MPAFSVVVLVVIQGKGLELGVLEFDYFVGIVLGRFLGTRYRARRLDGFVAAEPDRDDGVAVLCAVTLPDSSTVATPESELLHAKSGFPSRFRA